MPEELVEVILANLSLFELAHIPRTCRSFRDIYRKAMAGEQKTRHDLLIKSRGRKRITAIIDCIMHVFRNGCDNPSECRASTVFADGGLHSWVLMDDQVNQGTSEMVLLMQVRYLMAGQWSHDVDVRFGIWPGTLVTVEIPEDLSGVTIVVTPSSLENLEGVAFLQALLSGGLVQFIYDSRKYCEVRVRWVEWGMEPESSVLGRLRAQIAPLLPFASQYIPVTIMVAGVYTAERLQLGPVSPPLSRRDCVTMT